MSRFHRLILTGWLLAAASLSAQTEGAGSLTGTIFGPDGMPVEAVEVKLINLSTAKALLAHSDIAGRFSFPNLASDRYSLAVYREGYAMQRPGPFEILPGPPLDIRIELRPLAPPLTRPRAGLEGMPLEYGMVREQIGNVPVLLGAEGRTAVDKLLLLVPGMSPVNALEINPFTGTAASVSANGSRKSAINYQIDGGSNNAQNRITGAQAATYGPAPEAVETFRVVTNTYSAREGRNAGAVVSAVTRSGGNSWHGELRGFWRPRGGNTFESFDGSQDTVRGFDGGGQIGGPISSKHGIYAFLDAEAWGTSRDHMEVSRVLSAAERAGDFSGLSAGERPIDPATGVPFPDGMIPASSRSPLVSKYLDTFLPAANISPDLARTESTLDSSGEVVAGRIDFRRRKWSLNLSHQTFRNQVFDPLQDVLLLSPTTAARRRQLSHSAQIALTQTPAPWFVHTARVAAQRLSSNRWQGSPEYHDTPANAFGFDFTQFGGNPGTIPDVTLLEQSGATRLRIAPFLFAESSAQTNIQASSDIEMRHGGQVFRGGVLFQRGIWPVLNTGNFAGSFQFSNRGAGGTGNSVANLLLGVPAEYRIQTPRSLNLRWREFAAYAETELRPARGLQFTLGIRLEDQPPAFDRLDRIAAFRETVTSQKFPNTLPNLIFPGDPDGDFGPLPRSTVRTNGRNIAPRVGFAYSPTFESRWSRWLLGESGRSVFRAAFGTFYDFGAFGGSSASALFQATYPPYSVDNRFDFSRQAVAGSFRAPFSSLPGDPFSFSGLVSYPILTFDPNFENAKAQHWNFGWQRLLPGRIYFSAIYVGTRSERLQRQRELNVFVRNPIQNFSQILRMRRYQRYTDVRQFESSGTARYHGLQLRANRYLTRNLAFDIGYTWSKSFDDGSSAFSDELVTEPWTRSSFDRRYGLTAAWFYQIGLPRSAPRGILWADKWQISGIWRLRSGLPLDIRQTQDPTYSFVRVGRPDQVAPFRMLDPSEVRTFTLPGGRAVTGHFAFDPTSFAPVVPTDFSQLRQGTAARNGYEMSGFQQWDLRISRPVAVTEALNIEFGLDLLNAFNQRNWDAPWGNIDHPYFGVVRSEGLGRTVQMAVRFSF